MAVSSAAKTLTIFKFDETGMVAPCNEVNDFFYRRVGRGMKTQAEIYRVDPTSGRFVKDFVQPGTLCVVFDYLPGAP